MRKITKKKALELGIVFLMTATVISGIFTKTVLAAEEKTKTIEVNGKGIVSVSPDLATLYLGVETVAPTAEGAQAENAKIVANAINELKKIGIAESNIKTSQYTVYPDYKYHDSTGERTVTGYRANYDFQVKTKEINSVGKILDTAIKAGVSSNHNISYSVENPKPYYAQALKLAVNHSKENANVIAGALGVTLGSAVNVTEQSSGNSYYRTEAASSKMMDGAGANTSGMAELYYDTIEITAAITATYEY